MTHDYKHCPTSSTGNQEGVPREGTEQNLSWQVSDELRADPLDP